MAITRDYHAALASERPLETLRRTAARELDAGVSREQILAELEELRVDLSRSGRETDEDLVLELMDFVTGWCSPRARL